MRITEYVVEGDGPFPVDMLRYDGSYPADGESAANLLRDVVPEIRPLQGEARKVILRHRDVYAGWLPTVDRWASFQWYVDMTRLREWVV